MDQRYLYADKIGAGPEYPSKRWGLFSEELTAEEARARYDLNAVRRKDWFGIIPVGDDGERPRSFLAMGPQANGVELQRLDANGSVTASYIWRAYYQPTKEEPFTRIQERVFLGSITWYTYPDGDRFLGRTECLGHVMMNFRPDGHGTERRTIKHGFGTPPDVEVREFRDVDVSINWFEIPAFGEWGPFFHPTPDA